MFSANALGYENGLNAIARPEGGEKCSDYSIRNHLGCLEYTYSVFKLKKKKLAVEKNLKNAAIFSIILCVLNTQNVTNMTMCQIFLAQVLQIKQNITNMFRKFEAPNV